MKKHLSVFELAARGAVYKTLAVGLAAAAAIFALLLAGLDDVENLADVLTGLTLPYEGANGLPSAALAGAAYGAGMVMLYFLLARSLAPRRGVNPDATFRRLLIPEREAAYIQVFVHTLCFAVYRALALAAYLGFSAWFVARSGPYANDGMSVFFAAYKSLPLHTLLPLGSLYEGVHAAASCLMCGVGSVALSFWRRRRMVSGIGVAAGFVLALTHFLRTEGGELHMIFVFLELVLVAAGLAGSFRDTIADEREAASAAALETQEGGGANATA